MQTPTLDRSLDLKILDLAMASLSAQAAPVSDA
jgi:hypothetical protein